jgi:hypothetical protein
MTRYEHIEGIKHLRIRVFYDKGGMNYLTSTRTPRGYHLSVSVVDREERENGVVIESFTAYSGLRTLLLETKRQSDKAYETAVSMSEPLIERMKAEVLQPAQK